MKNLETTCSRRALLLAAAAAGSVAAVPASAAPRSEPSMSNPPHDATVLFDGSDASNWLAAGSHRPCPWRVENGDLEVVPGTGNIESVPRFTDFQLHVEFNIPDMPDQHSQGKGNSGVYCQGLYEIQVLDSFNNETYANGMCGAIYLETPPLINACRPAGQWQTYDITYHAPRFGSDGKRVQRARATVYHNEILIHDNDSIEAPTTAHGEYDPTRPGPIMLQDHGARVRYRNVWIRRL